METKFPILVSTMVLSILVIGIVIVPATSDSLAIRREAATGGRTIDGTGGVGVVAVSPTVPPTVPPVVMPPSGGGPWRRRYIYGWRYDWTSTSTSTSTCHHCWSRRSWWSGGEAGHAGSIGQAGGASTASTCTVSGSPLCITASAPGGAGGVGGAAGGTGP